jgi:gliding motility-associated-like protein
VTVTDAHLCDTIVTVTINEPLLPLSASATGQDVLCYGGNTGSIDLTVTGGTSPYYYLWNNGFTTEDITNLTQGIYIVTVTDLNLCQTILNQFIDQPDEPVFILSADQWLCYGQTTTLSVAFSQGGMPPYDFIWSNGMHGDSIVITPLITADYIVHMVDANGCEGMPSSIHVDVDKPLSFDLFVDKDTVCINESVKLQATIAGGGGAPYTIYVNDSIIGIPPIPVSPDTTTLYVAYVYDRCHFDSIADSVLIHTYPLPPLNMMYDKASGCQPLTVSFLESSLNTGQSYLWNFDDGDFENLSFVKNPVHTFYNAVVYHVRLQVTSKEGCVNESDTALITVFPRPDARFLTYPLIVTLTNPVVSFTDLSSGHISQSWDFGDGGTSLEKNPAHAYSNYGNYTVELYVKSSLECADSTTATIHVESDMTFYAPTAFSPDNDNHNEYFRVFASGYQSNSFNLYLYDRWGELIYYSKDIEKGWNGKVDGGKKLCPPGVYTWIAIFKDNFGNSVQKAGSVTLIR